MTDKKEISFEIAKLQVKEAIKKFCRERNLGPGSYNKIVSELFFDGLPGVADLYNTNVSGFLREMADEWDKSEGFYIDDDTNRFTGD